MFFEESLQMNEVTYTSRDVFAKRKENLDQAYQMALKMMKKNSIDEWNIRAFAWCLIDLIKRYGVGREGQHTANYLEQLNSLEINFEDEILAKQIIFVNRMAKPSYAMFKKAKVLSQNGRYNESIDIYKKIISQGENSLEIHLALAWDLFRYSKVLMEQEPPNVNLVKQCLNNYLRLNIEKPSVINSQMLRIALGLSRLSRLDMSVFFKMWGQQFNLDDYKGFITNDGRELPSLFESVLLQALKEALKGNDVNALTYYEPVLDEGLSRYSNNIWLVMRKAQVLNSLGKQEEAQRYAKEVVKQKSKDYWAWELLGDVYIKEDYNFSIACYSKALLCSEDLNFTGKLKIKMAKLLVDIGSHSAAKYELQSLIDYRSLNGQKIPVDVENLQRSDWFIETTEINKTNEPLYLFHAKRAEELLYEDIEWRLGSLGEIFTMARKDKKSKCIMRRVYVQQLDIPEELVILDEDIKLKDKGFGKSVRIKADKDQNDRLKICMIEDREGGLQWDVFSEKIGVVDNVNVQKKLIHFIIDRNIDGIVNFSELGNDLSVGNTIAVRLSKYLTKNGIRYRVLDCKKTETIPSDSLLRSFKDRVKRISGSGFGFTDEDIFIAGDLVKKHKLKELQEISGKALISFDKKHSRWGWQAIEIESSCLE